MSTPIDPDLVPARRGRVLTGIVVGALVVAVVVGFVVTVLRIIEAGPVKEGMTTTERLRAAELQHYREHGRYVAVPPCPPDASADPAAAEAACDAAWDELGWHYAHDPTCRSEVQLVNADTPTSSDFAVITTCPAAGGVLVVQASRETPATITSTG